MNPPGAVALAGLVFLPAVVGVLLLIGGHKARRLAGPLAVGTTLIAVLLAVVSATLRPTLTLPFLPSVPGGSFTLAVDGLSAVLILTTAVVACGVTIFAAADLSRSEARARFFGFLLLFIAAMLATVTATTIPTLLLAWEIMGATSYALIGYRWELPGKAASGTTAFLATRAGDLGLYVAAGAALAGTGSFALADLSSATGPWRDVAAAGIILAALGKSAQLPFSAWLSAAMEGPSPVSALLHSATMVAAGGYLLLRTQPLLAATGWGGPVTAWVGALTALVLGLVAAAQRDLKQLLAASTGAQIGFVVLGAGLGIIAGGTAQLVAHAVVKAALFVAAGAWLSSLGTKQLGGLAGVARRHRGIAVPATAAALALAGFPPLSLWATKEAVIAGAGGLLWLVATAGAALSALYAGRLLSVMFAPVGTDEALDEEEPGSRRVPRRATAVAAVFAVGAVGFGAFALLPVANAGKAILGVPGEPAPELFGLLLAGALGVAVLTLTLVRPRLAARLTGTFLTEWAGLRVLLQARPWLAIARAAAYLDTRVIDAAVSAIGTGVLRVGKALSRADVDLVDGAVRGVAAGTGRAGVASRRPQTGLLHQYYVQAVVGLGALFLVLLLVR